ncbi:MAG: hypothetical protein IKS64_04070 [Muribaculaceae bacterium]|nr:hypothetical protein [Muribaculaceae bacterium]
METAGVTLVFDYYIDPAGVLDGILSRAQKVYVFVSHSHRDHLCPDIFHWQERYPIARYVIANECRRKLKRSIDLASLPISFLHHDEDWNDGTMSVHAFDSTDVGICFLVEMAGRRIFHAGDYTCWHFSEEQDVSSVRKARGDFHVILDKIVAYSPQIDLAMMPVVPNIGGDWAYGAREFLRAIRVDTFIPMHMWGRDREATRWELYQNPDYGQCVHLRPGEYSLTPLPLLG